jgi:hypothetical protein
MSDRIYKSFLLLFCKKEVLLNKGFFLKRKNQRIFISLDLDVW